MSYQGMANKKKPKISFTKLIVALSAILVVSFSIMQHIKTKQDLAEKQALEQRQIEAEVALVAKKEQEKTDTKKYYEQFMALMTEWSDAVSLADKTPRIGLAGPVSQLQKIRRDADDFKTTQCSSPLKEKLILSMDKTINNFMAFMDKSALSQAEADAAVELYKEASTGVIECIKEI